MSADTRGRRPAMLASAMLVVLALAACSSSSSTTLPTLSASVQAPASPSAAPQPAGSADCATVASAADVSAIVGETVTGVGDSAYFSPAAHNLLAIQGTNFVSVGILLASLSDPTKEKAAAAALAQKVLSGL